MCCRGIPGAERTSHNVIPMSLVPLSKRCRNQVRKRNSAWGTVVQRLKCAAGLAGRGLEEPHLERASELFQKEDAHTCTHTHTCAHRHTHTRTHTGTHTRTHRLVFPLGAVRPSSRSPPAWHCPVFKWLISASLLKTQRLRGGQVTFFKCRVSCFWEFRTMRVSPTESPGRATPW